MKKKLFKNYSFEFDKNEIKVLSSFCKQVINQMQGDEKFQPDIRVFNSIIEKLSNSLDEIKLTKDEKTKLVLQLKENVKYIQTQIKKSWIFKKWLYRSMYNQYNNILITHFNE